MGTHLSNQRGTALLVLVSMISSVMLILFTVAPPINISHAKSNTAITPTDTTQITNTLSNGLNDDAECMSVFSGYTQSELTSLNFADFTDSRNLTMRQQVFAGTANFRISEARMIPKRWIAKAGDARATQLFDLQVSLVAYEGGPVLQTISVPIYFATNNAPTGAVLNCEKTTYVAAKMTTEDKLCKMVDTDTVYDLRRKGHGSECDWQYQDL